MRALLVGDAPDWDLGHTYVNENYEGVVIGSMSLSQLLCFGQEEVLSALAEGLPVVLYTPGLPEIPKNRALAATLAARRRELKSWGVLFCDGNQKKLITATAARQMREAGKRPEKGAVLTPLAREILEGLQ